MSISRISDLGRFVGATLACASISSAAASEVWISGLYSESELRHHKEAVELAYDDFEAGLNIAKDRLSGRPFEHTVTRIYSHKAQADPRDAVGLLALLDSGETKNRAIWFVANQWAMADFPEALQWAKNLKEIDERVAAFDSIAFYWGSSDKQSAIDYAMGLPKGDRVRAKVLNNVLVRWTGRAPRDAMAWVEAQGLEGDEDVDSVGVILRVWSARRPAEVFEYLTGENRTNLESKAFREEAFRIFLNWSNINSAQATKASLLVTERRTGDQVFAVAFTNWLDSAPTSAAEWADALPAGPTKDRAIEWVLHRKVANTLESRLVWMDKIQSDRIRMRFVEKIVASEPRQALLETLNDSELALSSKLRTEFSGLVSENNSPSL